MTQKPGKTTITGGVKNMPVLVAKTPSEIRLFVNGPGYDDIGRILRRMGQQFKFRNASEFKQANPTNAVLFLNCGGPKVANAGHLRRFVQDGGTIYASDRQATLIARTFPDVFTVSKPMPEGEYKAEIDDQGLIETLGGTLRLHFDAGDWRLLIPISDRSVKVYVSIPGLVSSRASVSGSGTRAPVVLGYDMPGGGTVFFTAFHGVAQQSRKVKELIRFLILRPVMSRELRTARLTINQASDSDCLEFVGGLSKSTPFRDHAIRKAGVWRVSLSWHGNAKVRLELRDRCGQVYTAAESRQSPLLLGDRTSGDAYLRVCALQSEGNQVPYCLLATRDLDQVEHS